MQESTEDSSLRIESITMRYSPSKKEVVEFVVVLRRKSGGLTWITTTVKCDLEDCFAFAAIEQFLHGLMLGG